MGRISIEDIVQAVRDLPALPSVVTKIMKLTEDPNSTAQDINNALSQDQAMTARVLKLANSAFYGFPRRIATVTDATVFLGFKTIKSIVMAASVSDILNTEIPGYALEHGELWKHSQCVAMAARHIARKVKFAQLDLAYTGGLLHDIGKVILNNAMKEAYHEVVARINEKNIDFIEAENAVLGFNHALVGARVAEKWNLPPELVDTIAHHHNPERAHVNNRLTSIVHLADVVCVSMGIGIGIDGMLYTVSAEALKILGLDENDIYVIINELTDIFVDEQSFMI
ncbi:HDOD domain-containing protein [Thermosyntropha sp.]|uniref:HDOD domain-containing protein n=1 Tax=Thermosyntropha sp. TaxID=2740820 RepID=UPI0025DA9B8D|nr:HDOD domain-containing protein [Thermosyntropha sp.]MBO8159531.1 HDOD domain-containing protein [Thermosyntropha sp.]